MLCTCSICCSRAVFDVNTAAFLHVVHTKLAGVLADKTRLTDESLNGEFVHEYLSLTDEYFSLTGECEYEYFSLTGYFIGTFPCLKRR